MTETEPVYIEDLDDIELLFLSEEFIFGACQDPECHNLHVLMKTDGSDTWQAGAVFNLEQITDMLKMATTIRRLKNKATH